MKKHSSGGPISFQILIVYRSYKQAMSKNWGVILLGIKLQYLAHHLRVTIDATLAAGLRVKLNLVVSKTQIAIDVLAGSKITNQHRLAMYEVKARSAIFRRRLRSNRLVAGSGHLHTGGHD